jgi:hypothetical protein
VVDDFGRPGRSPDVDRAICAVVVAPKEAVEAGDVVYVKVREQQTVDCLDLGHGQVPQAGFSTVEYEFVDRLARIDLNE